MAQYEALDPLLSTQVAYQFPVPTWIENLAVRHNGQVLVTLITAPELWLVDPADPSRTRLVHKFQDVDGLSGIIEVEHDIFCVAGGKFDLQTFATEPGSFKLFSVDFTNFDTGSAIVEIAIDLTNMRLPNGLALLSKDDRVILAADSEVGAIFKLDIKNRKHEVLIDAPETKNPEQSQLPIAANGVKVHDGYVYWSTTSKALFCRMKIDGGGKTSGDVEVLEQGLVCDDFCFDSKGNVWFTQNPLNTVGVRKSQGGILVVAGQLDQMTVSGCTACQFDRRHGHEHTLYVVTAGALHAPVNGQIEGGKVVAVDTSGFQG